MSGQLFIISAPSGGGKTSLVAALVSQDANLQVSISHTTRKPRPGEVNEKNYYFIDVDNFKSMVENQAFLEHAEVFDHYYGTSWKSVENIIASGKDAILEIDWQGAQLIKQQMECVTLFIIPPSKQSLAQRLKNRGQDSDTTITQRMNKAATEMQHYPEYDYLIINDEFNDALNDIKSIIRASRLKTAQQRLVHTALINELIT